MLDEYHQEHAYRQLYLQSLLLQLLIRIRRIQSATADTIAPERSEKQQRVYSVIAYLHAHYDESLSLDQLAEHFYISSTYLCRIFKQTTGFTLVEYLQDVRVQQARAYLRETSWKVTSIAEKRALTALLTLVVYSSILPGTPRYSTEKIQKGVEECPYSLTPIKVMPSIICFWTMMKISI